MGLPPPPTITFPAGTGKSKKPVRPKGAATGQYVAARLLAGSGRAWRGYYSQIEQQAKAQLGSSSWAPWLLAQLIYENPNGPGQNAGQAIHEVGQDILQSKGQVPDGVSAIMGGATGGYQPPLPPALPQPGSPGKGQRAAKTALWNGWATIKGGKLVSDTTSTTAPKNVVTYNGLPLTVGQFNTYWKQIDNIYIAYTGKAGSAQQIAHVLDTGVNLTYTLPKQLMQSKAFRTSPFWKQNYASYQEAWARTYGPDVKPDVNAIQKAMANRQSPTDFSYTLKYRADYVNSVTYKSNSATMQTQYDAIYGTGASKGAQDLIHRAVLAGWDPNQFASYLRAPAGVHVIDGVPVEAAVVPGRPGAHHWWRPVVATTGRSGTAERDTARSAAAVRPAHPESERAGGITVDRRSDGGGAGREPAARYTGSGGIGG